jgi:1D-myo-inositol-tetrakisphosphate 5-kinase/inositol-polyphosphate multikinase
MIQTAKDTTSLETGIRLTGFQVSFIIPPPILQAVEKTYWDAWLIALLCSLGCQNWDSSTSKMVITPKAYGKSLSLSQLPSGIALFFPTTSPSSPSAPSSSPSQPAPTPGLPQPLLLIILQQILEQLQTIESALSKTEARFVGMSLLVIYEGDEEALRQALLNQPPPRMDDEDGSAEDDDDDDDDDDEEDEDSLESGDELDDDEMGVVTSSSRQRKKTTSSVVVKLIDFAHSRVVDKEGGEQGPDLGVLTGIGTIVELVEGRLGEVILMDSGSRSAGGPAREMA